MGFLRRSNLTPEQQEHRKALDSAAHEVDAAIKARARRIREATIALEKARRLPIQKEFAGIALYPDRLQFPDKTSAPLVGEVHAEVDSGGGIAYRAHMHGKRDFRELYLLIEGPAWAKTIKCNPAQGANARAFAQHINVLARNSEANGVTWQAQVTDAERSLADAEQDTALIDAALEKYARLEKTATYEVPASAARTMLVSRNPVVG